MIATINSVNETEFHFISNVIKEIRAASKRSDNQALLYHINKTSATNMDRNDIDKITSSMLEKKLIYDKPSKKGTSYYIMEQMNDDIDNNTDNTNHDQIANIRQFTGTYPKYFRKRWKIYKAMFSWTCH